MSTEEKFRAAVNVIRNLPKQGSYQPSHELMLRFYAYFKQGTEGQCKGSRPGFWDIVGRLKYDAWAKLGDMPSEVAKEKYVEELKQIAETMSYTENVAKFMGSLDSFYDNVPVEDLELLWGPMIEQMRSVPDSPIHNTPLGSRETSPTRAGSKALAAKAAKAASVGSSPATSGSSSPQKHLYSSDDAADDDDDEEFIDTVESEFLPERSSRDVAASRASRELRGSPIQANGGSSVTKINGHVSHVSHGVNGADEDYERGRPRERNSPTTRRRQIQQTGAAFRGAVVDNSDVNERIRNIVLHLQRDLDRITTRVRSLEVSALSQVPASLSAQQLRPGRLSSWLPLSELSPKTVAFVIVWPFAVHFLLKYLERRRMNRRLL